MTTPSWRRNCHSGPRLVRQRLQIYLTQALGLAVLGCGLGWGGTAVAQPSNDSFKNAREVTGGSGTVTGTNEGATKEAGEPNHALSLGGASIWFRWTSTAAGSAAFSTAGSSFDTVMAVYRGEALDRLTLVGFNDDDSSVASGSSSKVMVNVAAGETLVIAVDGYASSFGSTARTGTVVFRWDLVSKPANDNFLTPELLPGADGQWTGHNGLATIEAGESQHSAGSGGHSLWFRWLAPAAGEVSFSTVGSDFDTVIAAYTGSRLDGLKVVARNDDVAERGGPSRVAFTAVAGETYSIAVDGYSSAQFGAVALRWECASCLPPPGNDALATAQELVGGSGSIEANTLRATKEPSEPWHAGNRGGRSLWYRWRPPGSGVGRLDTDGTGFDTLLAVYQGGTMESLVLIAANDDRSPDGPKTSQVRFAAAEGQSYFIALDGRADYEASVGEGGRIKLQWACEQCASQSTEDFYLEAGLGQSFQWASDPKRFYRVQGMDVFGEWEDIQTGIPGLPGDANATVPTRKAYSDYRVLAMTGEYLRPIGPVTNFFLNSTIRSRGVGDKLVLGNLHGAGALLSPADYVEATYGFNQVTRMLEPTVSEVIPDLGVTLFGELLSAESSAKVLVGDPDGEDLPPGTEHALSVPSGTLRARLSAGQVLGLAVLRPTEDLFLEIRDSRREVVLSRFVGKKASGGRELSLPILRTGEYSIEFVATSTNVGRASLLFRDLNSNPLTKLASGQQFAGAFSDLYVPAYYKYSISLKSGQRLVVTGTVGSNLAVAAVDDRSTLMDATGGGGIVFVAPRDAEYFVFVFRTDDATTGQFNLLATIQ